MPVARFSSAARASMPAERSSATTSAPARRQPARAGRRAAADLQHPPPGDVPEQVGVGLAQPLGAPQEVGVAEVGAVLGEVGRRRGVPPAPVGAGGLVLAGRAPGDAAGRGIAVAAQRAARRRGRRGGS